MDAIGSFASICRTASSIPLCSIFVLRGDKNCALQGLNLGLVKILDIADVILCLIFLCCTVLVAYRTHSKYAAVGRSEMGILNLLFFFLLVAQIISVGGWMTSEPELISDMLLWSAIVHVALIASIGWVILLNGFVGFQLLPDGSPASVYSIATTAILVFIGTGYIAADTALGITNAFTPGPKLMSIPLLVLVLVVPAAAAVLYFITQVLLVFTQLSARKPLVFLTAALVFFALAQVFNFAISDSICWATSRYVDGKAFSTLSTFLAFFCMHKYWAAITEDEWEDFEDQF
ncbi:hypothetical protein H9P43_001393 [Blastocladiella emersonii ATCC 22665]|nr:hypothetical protein H9P43_001393 [Blastocladiella emersonii ATCC 22665]